MHRCVFSGAMHRCVFTVVPCKVCFHSGAIERTLSWSRCDYMFLCSL